MANNRAKAQNFILTYIDKLAPGGANKTIYQNLFHNMSDQEFDQFMNDIETGEKYLVLISPNLANSNAKITIENNLAIAEELGHNFFEKLWVEGKDDTPTYLTPNEYMVVDLPVRRVSQLLTKGISVPDDNKTIDNITGQPTGESKGAKISAPELQVCVAMGMEQTMVELMKYRGGDNNGLNAFNGMISKLGKANLATLSAYSSGVESTKSLKTYLSAMHLRSTL